MGSVSSDSFTSYFRATMAELARDALVETFAWIIGGPHPTKDQQELAKRKVSLLGDDEVFEMLKATADYGQ